MWCGGVGWGRLPRRRPAWWLEGPTPCVRRAAAQRRPPRFARLAQELQSPGRFARRVHKKLTQSRCQSKKR